MLMRRERPFWSATEKRDLVEDAVAVVRGWMECSGPVTIAALSERLAFDCRDVEMAMALLEAEGQVLRGRFTQSLPEGEIEWCNRRVLARIHRTTLGRLRREIDDAWERGTAWFAGKPCIWLDIESRTCRNYEYRPAVCRRFEPGCDTCLEYREENGIPTPPVLGARHEQ
mgnify:CR=1 FL=1